MWNFALVVPLLGTTGKGGMQARTLDRVQNVLEAAGVVFIAADAAGGPGVRLKG